MFILLTWNSLGEVPFYLFSSVSATFVSSSVLLIDISPTSIIIFTLSGNNNWGDTKSNFMRHESPASGRRSDAPAPASGGSRKYALLNSVFFFCLLVCSKLNLTCWLLYCSLYHILVLSTWVSWYSVHCSASMLMLPSNRHNFLRLYSENSLSILCFSVDFLILLFMYRKRLID